MSTDHIFAAQMWTWPEPMIKRDSHGRILVVNAAFLQLYGGTVDSWTGSPIAGWPDPQGPGQVARFESRIPLATGGEKVYDWVESVLTDGTALTLARDVSIFVQAQIPVPQNNLMQAQQYENMAAAPEPAAAPPLAAPIVSTQPVQEPPIQASDYLPAQAPVQAQPQYQPQTQAPIEEHPVAQAMPKNPAPEYAPETVASTPFTPDHNDKSPVVAPLPLEAPEQAQPAVHEPRDFERRALPIENQDAILGNNWRDAVIAKAAGLDDVSQVAGETEDFHGDESQNKPSGQGIKVLLAEDNAINALLTRTLLEAEGCHCDVVEDGELAVEAVKNTDYDMIFMDMRMPNMDGLEATRKIRAMGHGANTLPIVALTANAFDDDRNACFDSGMNDFMTKPVSAEELSDMVNTHTGLEAQAIAS